MKLILYIIIYLLLTISLSANKASTKTDFLTHIKKDSIHSSIDNLSNSKIGFKGIYLGQDSAEGCSKVIEYFKKKSSHYKQNKVECGNANYFGFGFFVMHKDNKINMIYVSSDWTDLLFNSDDLSGSELADLMIEKFSWLNNGLEADNKGWYYKNFKEGWYFYIDRNKNLFLKTIQQANIN